jgi:hypothetical protein cdiviTM7_00316
MKDTVKKSIKVILNDRGMTIPLIVNLVAFIAIAIFLTTAIKHSEAQVITRYTAYGSANFYRDHWYSLFGYIILAFMIMSGHAIFSVKLALLKRRSVAIFILWLTLGILIILTTLAYSIIKIASLG